jgi:hypothetical protein
MVRIVLRVCFFEGQKACPANRLAKCSANRRKDHHVRDKNNLGPKSFCIFIGRFVFVHFEFAGSGGKSGSRGYQRADP